MAVKAEEVVDQISVVVQVDDEPPAIDTTIKVVLKAVVTGGIVVVTISKMREAASGVDISAVLPQVESCAAEACALSVTFEKS